MTVTSSQSFEEAVAEYIEKSRAQIGEEIMEHIPPWPPAPFEQGPPPFEAALRLDSQSITAFARNLGDDNPLYTDPEYGKSTRYGCQIAPGVVVSTIRYPTGHGARRPEGYPVANFYSGTAFEFFDAIRVGSKFRTTKVPSELVEKQGSKGALLFLITELNYWDYHGDLLGKVYSTQIQVPTATMGGTRSMDPKRLGERMLYERGASSYRSDDIEDIIQKMQNKFRRGAETLYWEDVEVGERLGPVILPPWTLQDQLAYHFLTYAASAGEEMDGDVYSFEPAYHNMRRWPGRARIHPNTYWPWTPGNEHEDAVLSPYRTQPLPFDFGLQRCQFPQQLLTNWMGDDGFIRRQQASLRRPVFYSDVTTYTGEVVKKYKVTEKGEDGGVQGEHEYHAVGIRISGNNQVDEEQAPGTATVYLPSREGGPVRLPIPHLAKPPYVPFETFRRDWF